MIFDIEDYAPIPTDWTKVKLSDIAEFNKSAWSKKDAPEQIYYIDIASVSTAKMESPTLMDFADAPSRARRKVESGDIIISTVRPNLKQFVLIDDDKQNLTASTGFCVISPKRKEYTWLIYSLISSDFFTEYLVRVAQGAAYPAIKPTDISDASIGLPPKSQLDTFNLLAGSLWLKETANIAMNQTLEKIAQRIFKSWFIDFDPVKANAEGVPFNGLSPEIQGLFPYKLVDSKTEFGLIPEGWSRGVFEDLTSSISTGGTPKRTEPDYWENGIIPWLTSGEVKSGITTFTKEKITDIGLKNSAAKMWNENTIVVAMYGATAGEVCLLGSPMTTNQACCGLTPQNNSKAFLFLCARTEKERLVSKASGAAQQNLNKGIVANHPCVLPTSDVLDSFEKTVFPLIEKWKANEFQNKALERIRDKILPRLISGKILLSDVNQELKETA